MNNLIKQVWYRPEDESWKNIRFDLVSEKVYSSAAAPARSASWRWPAAAAGAAPKLVLEYIFNWNMTWWQNN